MVMSNKVLAVGMSVLFHIALGVLMLVSVDFSDTNPTQDLVFSEPVINAVAVDESALKKQVKKIKDQQDNIRKKEEQRVKELEKRAQEAEKDRKLAESKVSDLKKQTENQQAEKKRAEQAAVAARDKQKKEQELAKKLEAERVKKEKERKKAEEQAKQAKAKREKEEKALKDAERKRQEAIDKAEQEKLLEEQLQAEQATRQNRRSKQVLSEVQKYQALIKQTIQRNLIVDDSMKGKTCRLNIRLASNGLVTQVKELAGDKILCRAAISAVYKSDTLPISSEDDVYQEFKEFNLTVEPEL